MTKNSPMHEDRQLDLFLGELLAPASKDDIGSMEHPLFSIKKGGDRKVRRYEHRSYFLEVVPSVKGSATIWDKDILIYLFSLMRQSLDRGKGVPDEFEVSAADLLRAIQRSDSGRDYDELVAGLERLRGTNITTNIPTGLEHDNEENFAAGFSLLSDFQVLRDKKTKRLTRLIFKPSSWFTRQVFAKHLLTLDARYFSITSGIERRLYELARKHCGDQAHWFIGLDTLRRKIGVTRELRKFRSEFRAAISAGGGVLRVIDYACAMDAKDIVHVFSSNPKGRSALATYLLSVRDTTETTHELEASIDSGDRLE
ncbi:plasmid replication initiator RepA (plasmid) [Pseudolysobacter antarcticus]|uniref:Plasmid replication initiator RepA n=1 Tax=Pseudolysobacter antarcticus TaxID=2511995 RepID=A0A411HEK1_9GAMM|nr:replication initiator protein A [Pseudolysobacter antarcticus]QBB68897.1 plasmid replication initiator RepA [Pseudolysobacter antarcticus]